MASDKKTTDLEFHIGFWLRFVSNHVSHSFRDKIAECDVTVAEWVALRSLYNLAPCTLSVLAQHMGIDFGTCSRLVDRIIKKKFASRKVSKSDRRAVKLDLTEAGRAVVSKIACIADENDNHFFSRISKEDRNHLLRIMKRLVKEHGLKEKPTS